MLAFQATALLRSHVGLLALSLTLHSPTLTVDDSQEREGSIFGAGCGFNEAYTDTAAVDVVVRGVGCSG